MHSAQVLIVSGLALTIPLLWAALGEVINERAGVVNVSVEGVMLLGAFCAALVVSKGGGLALATLAGLTVGIVSGIFLSWLYVIRRVDQIVGGILFNLAVLGITTVLYGKYLSTVGSLPTLGNEKIPLLGHVAVVGAFFDQSWLAYGAFVAAGVVYYVSQHTWLGVSWQSVGEDPLAAEACGLRADTLRTSALMVGSGLAGIGGAAIVVISSGSFVPNITNGAGYIAIAIVMLSSWRPQFLVLGAALFGFAESLQYQAQTTFASLKGVPVEVWEALPYLVAIVAIVIARGRMAPKALGVPYKSEGRAFGRVSWPLRFHWSGGADGSETREAPRGREGRQVEETNLG